MIIFKALRWSNLLSYGNVVTELMLDSDRTTLIIGENGVGKSTFIEALVFCLYGKPFRKINKPQLVNSINKKGLLTEVEFSIGDNEYKVIRGIKPNIFEIWINGEMQNLEGSTAVQQDNFEKNVLRLNYKSFCQIVILGNASYVPFMQLEAKDRRTIVEDILSLKVFSTMNLLVKADIDSVKENLVSVNMEISDLENKIKYHKEYEEALLKDTNSEIERINTEILNTKEEVAKNQENLSIIMEKVKAINNPKAGENVENSLRNLLSLKGKIESKNENFRNDLKFFKETEVCPTCSQKIDDDHRNKIIECKEIDVTKTDEGLIAIAEEIKKHHDKLLLIKKVVDEVNNLQINMSLLTSTIHSDLRKISSLELDIERIKKKQEKMHDQTIDKLEEKLQSLVANKNLLMENMEIYTAALPLLKDDGIKAAIIDQYIPKINKIINQYLSQLDFFVQFELDKEFNEVIRSRYRDEFSYASFSEGEKLRIDLALLFTWREIAKQRNSTLTNILILDEILDSSLDYAGTEEFIRIIKDLTQGNNSFIISHKWESILEKFDNVVKFEKVDNFSRKSL